MKTDGLSNLLLGDTDTVRRDYVMRDTDGGVQDLDMNDPRIWDRIHTAAVRLEQDNAIPSIRGLEIDFARKITGSEPDNLVDAQARLLKQNIPLGPLMWSNAVCALDNIDPLPVWAYLQSFARGGGGK